MRSTCQQQVGMKRAEFGEDSGIMGFRRFDGCFRAWKVMYGAHSNYDF